MSQIDRLMKALADAESRVDTPPHVERAVMAAWDETQRDAHRADGITTTRPSRQWLAVAAGLLLAVAIGAYRTASDRPARPRGVADIHVASAGETRGPATHRAESPATTVDASPEAIVTAPTSSTRHASVPAQGRRRSSPGAAADTTTVVLIGAPVMAGESVRVVRMRVPGSTLSAMGISPAASARTDRSDRIDLDVLVGEDGVARAVRFGM